jgi:hypothetical protein
MNSPQLIAMPHSLPEVQTQLLKWTGETSILIGDIFDAVSKRFTEQCFPDRQEGLVLWQLQASCHATAESALILVANVRLWDADVIIRSVVEGTLKFVFLTLGSDAERKMKLTQFDIAFAEIGQLKRHNRLEQFLSAVGDADADEWRSFREMLLSKDRLAELQAKYPKKVRHSVEHRWSFGEICQSLRRSGIEGVGQLGHMMFNYGMSSHVAHQDIDGIGMVWDRNGRSDERRAAVELAHGARLISDVAVMSWLRAHALFKRCGCDNTPLKEFGKRLAQLHVKTAAAADNFHQVEYGTPSNTETSPTSGSPVNPS